MSISHDKRVLLLGGPSGVGKSVAARELGLRLGIPWMQVDDLRLALQYSRVTLPQGTPELYFFMAPDVWQQSPERLCRGLIDVGELLLPALEIVIAHHVDTQAPLILEGDGILPSLLERPLVSERAKRGSVSAAFVVEPNEAALLDNMLARGRGIDERGRHELETEARAKWLFGERIASEARERGLPVLEARPWATLADRLLAAFNI